LNYGWTDARCVGPRKLDISGEIAHAADLAAKHEHIIELRPFTYGLSLMIK